MTVAGFMKKLLLALPVLACAAGTSHSSQADGHLQTLLPRDPLHTAGSHCRSDGPGSGKPYLVSQSATDKRRQCRVGPGSFAPSLSQNRT
jgi:hypothetical protein